MRTAAASRLPFSFGSAEQNLGPSAQAIDPATLAGIPGFPLAIVRDPVNSSPRAGPVEEDCALNVGVVPCFDLND